MSTPFIDYARKNWRIRNEYVKGSITEFIAALVSTMFGVSAVMQHVLQPGNDSMQPAFGGAFGLMIALLICDGISGTLNPAITLGLAIAGRVSWYKVPLYLVVQVFGAYVGAGLVAANYYWLGSRVDGSSFTDVVPALVFGHVSTDTPIASGILDQTISCAVLLMLVLAVIDKRNMAVPKYLLPFYVALSVIALILCFGVTGGAALSPAKELGSRLMAISLGYNSDQVFTPGGKHWWTVGFFGPLIGAAVGSTMYVVFIASHLNDTEEEALEKKMKSQQYPQTQFQTQPTHVLPSPRPPGVGGQNMMQGRSAPNNYTYDMNGNIAPSQVYYRGGPNSKSYA
jgi:glycerol uptake facilitator-like aquaporin